MRFSARLACSLELLDVDDVLMQDELLDTFDLGEFSGNVDPKALADAMKRDRFARSNRFHLCLPHGIGRLRMTVVEDDVLMDNISAWCDAHAPAKE